MEIKVIEKKEIPLLSRERITLQIKFQGSTPSVENVRKEAAKALGTDEKLTIVRHIYPKFGKSEAKIITHVYKNEKEMLEIEDKVALMKNIKEIREAEKAKKTAAAQPAAQAAKA